MSRIRGTQITHHLRNILDRHESQRRLLLKQQGDWQACLVAREGFFGAQGKPMRECVQGVGVRLVRRFDRPFATDAAFQEELRRTLEIG